MALAIFFETDRCSAHAGLCEGEARIRGVVIGGYSPSIKHGTGLGEGDAEGMREKGWTQGSTVRNLAVVMH